MRNIITLTLFLLLSNNAFACYDENLSDSANFNQCTAEAKQENAVAQYNLGVMYERGLGVAQDDKKAVEWLTKAAEQGNPKALKALASLK